MTDRSQVEALLREAYAARKDGDVDRICACFAEHPTFAMAGTREASPIAVQCYDGSTFRTLMSGLTATFEWLDHQILTMIVDGSNAAVHWRARIRVMPSGEEVETELVDVLTIDAGKIRSMTEFCDTALAARLMGADMGRPAGAMA